MAIFDVIKYEGTSDVIVFKHPTVDFNTKAQLIVHDKQEAIVFMNGEPEMVYPTGKYELKSANLPGVKHIVALFSGGEMANHCEVYFINQQRFANVPWVTTAMDIQDKTIGNYYSFRAQGFFSVRVSNSYKIFDIVGNEYYFTTEQLKEYFKERITSAARETLSITMTQKGISYGEINSHLSLLSTNVMEKVKAEFENIGLMLEEFRFDSVNMDKDDEFAKHRGHLGERSGQQIEGYTHDKRRMYDVMEKQAENESGSGAAASMMSGAGFGMGMGQVYSGMVNGAARNVMGAPVAGGVGGAVNNAGVVQPHQVTDPSLGSVCPHCGKKVDQGWVFCPSCGNDLQSKNVCPNCGAKLPSGGEINFCPKCRTKLH